MNSLPINNKTLIFSCLLAVSLAFCGTLVFFGESYFNVVVVSVLAIPIVYAIFYSPQFGLAVLLILAYSIMFLLRIGVDFPLGTVLDGLECLLIFAFLFKQKYTRDWSLFNNASSIMILVWIGYNFLEVLNPEASSKLAWLYTIRSIALISLTYFLFMQFITSAKLIKMMLKLWITLSVIAALYGLKQEFIGFAAFEETWLHSDPRIAELLYIGGHWRIFSIFSDPVVFAYNMAAGSILCIALLTGPVKNWQKLALAGLIVLFVSSMLYSGTRGAFVLIPAALALLAILKFRRKMLLVLLCAGVALTFFIMVPTSNPTLYRFQSAFRPTEDASFNLRAENQKKIQPYILSHPFGGGLGATGTWGKRFAPNSYLANFPPDSGYVRVAVESGWVGLLIYCSMVFTFLLTGINNFYKIKDPVLKSYCLAMLLIVFVFNIGNYPQEAIVQYPSSILFYLAIAIINISLRLEQKRLQKLVI